MFHAVPRKSRQAIHLPELGFGIVPRSTPDLGEIGHLFREPSDSRFGFIWTGRDPEQRLGWIHKELSESSQDALLIFLSSVPLGDGARVYSLIARLMGLVAVEAFGLTRVMARLGKTHSHYPWPTWSDFAGQGGTSMVHRPTKRGRHTVQRRAEPR